MQQFSNSLFRQFPNAVTGNAATGVSVNVYELGTTNAVTLYADDDLGGATLPNPLTTNDIGFYSFYAPDGKYTLNFGSSQFPDLNIQLVDALSLVNEFNTAQAATGFILIDNGFSAGYNVTQRNEALLFDGVYYVWKGGLPKTVTAGSSVASTGGIGNGAWQAVLDNALRQELVDGTADVGGVPAVTLSKTSISVNCIKELEGITPRANIQYDVAGYYEDAIAGGGPFIYDSTRSKSEHNGGTVIAPEAIAAWDGTQADIAAILNWTPTGGAGCWVRVLTHAGEVHVEDFGAIPVSSADTTTNSTVPINKAIESMEPVRGAVFATGMRYCHRGIKLRSYVSFIGNNSKESTELYLISGSNTDSVSLFDRAATIKPTLKYFRVLGNKSGNTSGHGINFDSTVVTAGEDAVRPDMDTLQVYEAAQDGVRLFGDGVNFVGANLKNITSYYSGGKGFRFRRTTDGYFERLTSGGNSEEGYLLDNHANCKFTSCKSFYNGEFFNGRGWSATGGRRNTYIMCEAQEDFALGMNFFDERDSTGIITVDANGRAATPGIGFNIQNCQRFTLHVISESFQNPTWQSTAMRINTGNIDCHIFVQNNYERVATLATVVGTTNDNVTVQESPQSLKKLVAGAGAFIDYSMIQDSDYVAGTFIPTMDFGSTTSGDLSVTYTTQKGSYVKFKNQVTVNIELEAAITHTTATGNLFIRQLPYLLSATSPRVVGALVSGGIADSLPNLVQLSAFSVASSNVVSVFATVSGAAPTTIAAAQVPSGSFRAIFTLCYTTDQS